MFLGLGEHREMNQLVAGWNLVNDILATARTVDSGYSTIGLRGNSRAAALSGELRLFLRDYPAACLSVTDITGGICPGAVDAYLNKSPHSPLDRSQPGAAALRNKIRKGSYQQRAGILFEDLLRYAFPRANIRANVGYRGAISRRDNLMQSFREQQEQHLEDFHSVEPPHADGGNPSWFVQQLECSIGQELSTYCVQKSLWKDTESIRKGNVKTKPVIELPDRRDIGIKKATPDFIIRQAKLVGDIKTGEHFQYKYMLACAGYAITFEKRMKRHIDWGAIVFEPTEVCTARYQPVTFPQLYFFRITDDLRRDFLARRDDMYIQNQREHIDGVARQIYSEKPEICRRCQRIDQCSEIFRFSDVRLRVPAANL